MANENEKACSGGLCGGTKVALVVALIVAVGLVVWAKGGGRCILCGPAPPTSVGEAPEASGEETGARKPGPAPPAGDAPPTSAHADTPKAVLPRLVDLGADKCIPCKAMAPILEELKTEYVGRFEVEFIDVWKHPDAAEPYGIRLIPTQVFFDASGEEVFRHEGFFSKEDILTQWQELGLDFAAAEPAQQNEAPPAANPNGLCEIGECASE